MTLTRNQKRQLLRRSPMRLADWSFSRVLAALPITQDDADRTRRQLEALFPTMSYAEAKDYLLEWVGKRHLLLYCGGHHFAVHSTRIDYDTCLFRVVEMFPAL